MSITPVNTSARGSDNHWKIMTVWPVGMAKRGSVTPLINHGGEWRRSRNLMENFQEWMIFNNSRKSGTLFFRFIFLPVSFVITPLFITLSLLIISSFPLDCLVSSSSLKKSLKWPDWSYISDSFLHINIPPIAMRVASRMFCSAFPSISPPFHHLVHLHPVCIPS